MRRGAARWATHRAGLLLFAFFFFFKSGWVFVRVSGWLAVACRVVRGGSQWVAVGRRGVGSRWVVGLGCGVALSLSTSHCHCHNPFFSVFFFLDFPVLLDF